MGTILVIAREAKDRQNAALAVVEAGFGAATAENISRASDFLEGGKADAIVLVASAGNGASRELRQIADAYPLIPVVAALTTHDAAAAIELLKAGASEVLAPPWSRENARAALSRAVSSPGTILSLEPEKRPSPFVFYLFLALAIFGAVFSIESHRRARQLREAELAAPFFRVLPYHHPSSIAFDGDSLWVADWFTQSVYRHRPPDWSVDRVAHFPAEMPAVIAFFGDSLWTVSTSGAVSQHMKDAQFTILRKYPSLPEGTVGLAFDGLYLWTLDGTRKLIVKHLLDSNLTALDAYHYPGLRPAALAWDGKTLWSLDQAGRELIRHNLDRPDEATGRVALEEYADGHFRPVGLAWDGGHFWTAAESIPQGSAPARVFRHGEALR